MATNVKNLTLANQLFHLFQGQGVEIDKAGPLVASAAMQLSFGRIAVGMASWSKEPTGHPEMQARLSNEQFDVLNLAPMNFSSQTSVTCLDLCAAAAFRLRESGDGGSGMSGDRECDLRGLEKLTRRTQNPVALRERQGYWLQGILADSRLDILERARRSLMHRSIASITQIPANTTQFILEGISYDILQLATDFVDFAQGGFEAFVSAAKLDYTMPR